MNKLKDAMKAQMKPSFNFEEGSDIGKQVNVHKYFSSLFLLLTTVFFSFLY